MAALHEGEAVSLEAMALGDDEKLRLLHEMFQAYQEATGGAQEPSLLFGALWFILQLLAIACALAAVVKLRGFWFPVVVQIVTSFTQKVELEKARKDVVEMKRQLDESSALVQTTRQHLLTSLDSIQVHQDDLERATLTREELRSLELSNHELRVANERLCSYAGYLENQMQLMQQQNLSRDDDESREVVVSLRKQIVELEAFAASVQNDNAQLVRQLNSGQPQQSVGILPPRQGGW